MDLNNETIDDDNSTNDATYKLQTNVPSLFDVHIQTVKDI